MVFERLETFEADWWLKAWLSQVQILQNYSFGFFYFGHVVYLNILSMHIKPANERLWRWQRRKSILSWCKSRCSLLCAPYCSPCNKIISGLSSFTFLLQSNLLVYHWWSDCWNMGIYGLHMLHLLFLSDGSCFFQSCSSSKIFCLYILRFLEQDFSWWDFWWPHGMLL